MLPRTDRYDENASRSGRLGDTLLDEILRYAQNDERARSAALTERGTHHKISGT